jgi:EAL domain-containing protein (putative c-di-GMP-specific phosphodiesterase class I)
LKAAGAGLAIDDFGTGLSALSQLRGLPFDSLKIDQSFVAQREDAGAGAEGGSSILRSIVGLARELELAVVAEGVETARDAQWLKDIGCEYAQGYYFSPALPRGDVLAFIARHHGGVGATQETAPALGVTSVRGKSGDVDPQLA